MASTSPTPSELRPSGQRWLHAWAILTAVAAFPLILAGGAVTSLRAGMADPVWPTTPWYLLAASWFETAATHGRNFLIEHGHRQIGWIVGALSIVLAVWCWRVERGSWRRWLGLIALVAVSVQGVLGGLRVRWHALIGPEFAMLHGFLGQLVFCTLIAVALLLSTSWRSGPTTELEHAPRIQRLCLMTTVLIVMQLGVGVWIRHGGLLTYASTALAAHLLMAFAVVAHIAILAERVLSQPRTAKEYLSRPTVWLLALLTAQLLLGFGTWLAEGKLGSSQLFAPTPAHALLATAHVGVGALLLATSLALTLRAYRHLAAAPQSAPLPVAATPEVTA